MTERDARAKRLRVKAEIYAEAAEHARIAGDTEASIALAVDAAKILQLHRLLYSDLEPQEARHD